MSCLVSVNLDVVLSKQFYQCSSFMIHSCDKNFTLLKNDAAKTNVCAVIYECAS